MLDKLPALIQAGSPTKCLSPGLLISHRQAGRVRLGWVSWTGVRLLTIPILRDAPGSEPPAASLGPAEVRGRQRRGYPGCHMAGLGAFVDLATSPM